MQVIRYMTPMKAYSIPKEVANYRVRTTVIDSEGFCSTKLGNYESGKAMYLGEVSLAE